jgi:hypothetical protein
MKILNAVTMMAILSTAAAFAGDNTINVVGRGNWQWKDNDVKKTGVSNSSSMNIDYLRTTFAGALTPTVKYFATADFLAANGTDNAKDNVDNTSAFIDEAFITKSFATGTGLTFGKKTVFIGGREYDYNNTDRYSVSYFQAATPANQVGATLTQEVAGQTLVAQYFNGNRNAGQSATTNAQSKYGYAVGWYGDIGGWLKPIVAYTVVPESLGAATSTGGVRINKGDDQFLGAGVQLVTPHNFILEADYNTLTEKAAIAGNKDLKTRSIVGQIRYAAERFAPFVKVISDERKSDSVKTNKRFAYDAGIEFKEHKEDAIRYQVVYSGSTVKDNLNTTELKSSPKVVWVGVKFDAAVLK